MCFPRKAGWVTRTGMSITAEINAFNLRKLAEGAWRLEDWINTLNVRYKNYQDCVDWLDGKEGAPTSTAIEEKIKEVSALYKTLREEVSKCLQGYDDPEPNQQVKLDDNDRDRCQLQPITDLKPEKLRMDDTPGKLRI